MAEERFDETEQGYYVQHGDIREWVWKGQDAPEKPKPVTTIKAEAVTKPKAQKAKAKR